MTQWKRQRTELLLNAARRTWVYVQPPADYEIAGCTCGDPNPQWSEFKRLLWCAACKKDFRPAHNGLFDGPISVHACRMIGISFDRFNLKTDQLEPFVI